MKEEEALVRVVRVVRGSWNSKGVSVVIHNNFNRETRENREQKGSVLCRFKAVQGRVQGEGFPSPPGWEPRAVKEEALVRAVRVVRGSWNSKGVSVVIHNNFNRETRENREHKRECPL